MDTGAFSDGLEYLASLRRENRKEHQSFNAYSRFLERRAREQGVPIHGQFELTPLCNLSCKMCYVHLLPEQLGGRAALTAEQWKALIRQAYDAGMLTACLTGGECLAYPGFDELYLYLHSLGCPVDVMTNGVLLNEDRIRFFIRHPPCSIQITLYGSNEDVYERVTGRRVFHTVMENIQRVKAAKLPLLLTITPNRFLGEDAFETIRTAWSQTRHLIINTSLFALAGESWRTEASNDPDVEYYARIRRYYKEVRGEETAEYPESRLPEAGGPCSGRQEHGLSCGGGRSGFVINWKGEMLICNRMAPKSYPLQDGFAQAWHKINEIAEQWPRASACRGCAYEEFCGFCAADALKYAQPGEKPAALCERTRYLAGQGVLNLPNCD